MKTFSFIAFSALLSCVFSSAISDSSINVSEDRSISFVAKQNSALTSIVTTPAFSPSFSASITQYSILITSESSIPVTVVGPAGAIITINAQIVTSGSTTNVPIFKPVASSVVSPIVIISILGGVTSYYTIIVSTYVIPSATPTSGVIGAPTATATATATAVATASTAATAASATPAASLEFNLEVATPTVVAVKGGVVSIVYTRSGSTSQAVSVSVNLIPGTATASDYTASQGFVTFTQGATSAVYQIRIADDGVSGASKSFTVQPGTISGSTSGTVTQGSATVTILGGSTVGALSYSVGLLTNYPLLIEPAVYNRILRIVDSIIARLLSCGRNSVTTQAGVSSTGAQVANIYLSLICYKPVTTKRLAALQLSMGEVERAFTSDSELSGAGVTSTSVASGAVVTGDSTSTGSGSNRDAAIGGGIGGAIGGLILIGAGVALFLWWKKGKAAEQTPTQAIEDRTTTRKRRSKRRDSTSASSSNSSRSRRSRRNSESYV